MKQASNVICPLELFSKFFMDLEICLNLFSFDDTYSFDLSGIVIEGARTLFLFFKYILEKLKATKKQVKTTKNN